MLVTVVMLCRPGGARAVVATRQGYLIEEHGMSYLADIDSDKPLASLQAASCAYRDGTTHIVMQPQEFMHRLAALVPARAYT